MDDVRAVMDAARSERAAILGAGDGGTMAAMFAATYPDRTNSLILANSAARHSWAPDYPIGVPPDRQEMIIRLVEQTWGTAEFATATNPSLAQEPNAREEAAKYSRLAASPATAAAVIRMLLQLDIRPILPSIRVPDARHAPPRQPDLDCRQRAVPGRAHRRGQVRGSPGRRLCPRDRGRGAGRRGGGGIPHRGTSSRRRRPRLGDDPVHRHRGGRPRGPPSSATIGGATCSMHTIGLPSGSWPDTEACS